MLLRALKVIGFAICLLGMYFVYAAQNGPEIFVVSGSQLESRQTDVIRDLSLLDSGESIKFFYSDAITDIREGMYFVTDQKLTLYCSDWAEPALATPFDEIQSVDIEYDDSFFADSYINVMLHNGDVLGFPVSSEKGGDKRFFKYLQSKVGE